MHLRDVLDLQTKRREWRIERVGWFLIAALVLLAILGAFGDGPISDTRAEAAQGDARFFADYERFNRIAHVSLLVVHVQAPSATGDELRIAFNPASASDWTIRSSHPSGSGEVDETGLVYTFPVEDWSKPFQIGFEYLPEGAGRKLVTVTVAAGDLTPVELQLPQFIYP